MRSRVTFVSLVLVFVAAVAIPAAQQPKYVDKATYFQMESISNPAISPDGSTVIFSRGYVDLSRDQNQSNLWVIDIKGERLRLFMIYSAGNFIECTTDTPYLQIGEHKYGKPVLDRAITYGVDLYDALKIGLISMDSTMRSNLGVGMPIDVLVARRDACDAELSYRIEPGEPYFHDLRERWSAALRASHIAIPRPPYAGTA